MLPILVALWQTDATVQGAIEEQIQSSFAPAGALALLTGGDLTLDAVAVGAGSTWALRSDGQPRSVMFPGDEFETPGLMSLS